MVKWLVLCVLSFLRFWTLGYTFWCAHVNVSVRVIQEEDDAIGGEICLFSTFPLLLCLPSFFCSEKDSAVPQTFDL